MRLIDADALRADYGMAENCKDCKTGWRCWRCGRMVTMQKGLFKKSGLDGLFTDFKHHTKSWRNSKKMRAKRERQWLKKLMKDGDNGKVD